MKKRLLISAAAVLALSLALVGASLAYLSAQDSATNTFTVGTLTAKIGEAYDRDPAGTSAKKEVWVINSNIDNPVDAYIRVMILPTFRQDGKSLAGAVTVDNDGDYTITAPDGTSIELVMDTAGWIYHDGAFYWTQPVAPGEKTGTLLKQVDVTNEDVWDILEIEVLSEAVQAGGQGAQRAWNAQVNSNGVITGFKS